MFESRNVHMAEQVDILYVETKTRENNRMLNNANVEQ